MKPSFDPVDWMIGISLLGGSSVMLLVGLLFARKYLAAVGVSAGVFIVGLAACLLVDFTLQHPAIEEFFRAGTHKRHAMRTFLPWSLGFVAGILSMGGLLQVIQSRRKERLRRENPDVHALLYPEKAETPTPSIERTSLGKPGDASSAKPNGRHRMRQRNVQQQNSATEEAIRHHARYWRSVALPAALVEAASARGVDCSTAIVLELEIDFPGMPRLFGMLLTNTERFIEFEIETDENHSTVERVEAWSDVTADQNVGMHNRGIGAAKGALAIKVLRELNAGA